MCVALIFKNVITSFFIGCGYGGVSNNHIHLRIELPTECKENPEQLIKVYVVWLKVLNIIWLEIFLFISYRFKVHYLKILTILSK